MAVDKLKLEIVLNAIDKLSRPLSAAKGKSRELAQAIKQTQERIKELDKTQEHLASGKLPLSNESLAAAMRESRAESDRLNASLAEQRAQLDKVNARMQKMGAINQSAANIARKRDSLAKAGVGLGAAGAATLAGVGATVSAYAEAEDAATGLRVAMMRANGTVPETFTQINNLAMRMGDKLPGTTADFQNMMTMLIRQGMSAESILGGLGEATAYLAVQMKMPTDQAAEFAAKMQDATRTSEKDMMGLMDVIQRSFYAGVDSDNMLNAFAKLSPALGVLKQEGLEGARALAPLIAMADQAGMKGEASGNAIRKVLQLSLDAKKVAKGNAAGGLNLDFTNGKGEFGGLDKLFAQLSKLQGMTTQQRLSVIKEIYGDDAETLQVVSLLIDKGKDGYAEMQKKMADQADLQKRVNEQLGTLTNLWEAASGTFRNLLATAGDALAPDLKAIVDWLGNAAASVREFAAEHPELMKWIMRLTAGIGVLLAVLGGLFLAAAALLTPFAMMGTLTAGFGVAMAVITSPIMAVVAAVGLLAAAAVMVWANWDGIKGGLIALWDSLAEVFIGAWTRVKTFFKGIWSEITAAFSEGIGGIAKLLLNWSPLGAVYDKVRMVASLFGKKLPPTAADALVAVANAGSEAGSQASRIASAKTGFSPRAPAAPVVQSGPSTFQIYAAPGMNPADVANLVDQKMQQRDAAQLTRNRSRLADNN